MGTSYKRGTRWQGVVRRHGHKPQYKTFRTKTDADRWIREMETRLEGGKVIHSPSLRLRDLLERYAEEVSPRKKGARWEKVRIARFIKTMSFVDVRVGDIRSDYLRTWRDERLKHVCGASVNREMNLLSAVFTYARKEWGTFPYVNPVHEVKRPPKGKSRDVRVGEVVINLLKTSLNFHEDQPPREGYGSSTDQVGWMVMLALETAMRLGELCSLRWENVHLGERWLQLLDTKNGEGRNVPLTAKAVELLTVLKGEKDRGPVFTVAPGVASTLFRKACRAAGVSGVRFHDLRHEATTRLSKKLTVLELAAVTGHRDLRSLQIYFNPHAWELAQKI